MMLRDGHHDGRHRRRAARWQPPGPRRTESHRNSESGSAGGPATQTTSSGGRGGQTHRDRLDGTNPSLSLAGLQNPV